MSSWLPLLFQFNNDGAVWVFAYVRHRMNARLGETDIVGNVVAHEFGLAFGLLEELGPVQHDDHPLIVAVPGPGIF